jgi:hypothetical protein
VADSVTPLCTWADFVRGAFADLARNYTDPTAQADLLAEATRMCEETAGRRLAPFTGVVETHRAQGIDPDEYTDAGNLPLDLQGTIGASYAYALGASSLVRHCWLNEFAPLYPELWAYSDVSITLVRSYGGSQQVTGSQTVGPELDSGHVWFNLGTFLPIGSLIRVTYSGGYQTTPASLRRACKLMVAQLIVRELTPRDGTRDPDLLRAEAEDILNNYGRE